MNNFNKFCFRGGRSEGAKGANALPPLFWKLENKASATLSHFFEGTIMLCPSTV